MTVPVSEANIQLIFRVLDSQEEAKTSIRVLEADDIGLVTLDRFYNVDDSRTCNSNDIDVYLRILNKTGTPICIEVDDAEQLVGNDVNTTLEMSESRHNEYVCKDERHNIARGNSTTAHETCRCDMHVEFEGKPDPTLPIITNICGNTGEDDGDRHGRDSSTESSSQMSTFQHQETLNEENRMNTSSEGSKPQNNDKSRNHESDSKHPKRVRLMEKPESGDAGELQIFCRREPTLHSRDNSEEGYPKPASEKPGEQSDDDVQITYYKSPTPRAPKGPTPTSQISQASSGSAQRHRSTSQAAYKTVAESEQRQPTRNPASRSRKKRRKPKGIYREALLNAKACSHNRNNRPK